MSRKYWTTEELRIIDSGLYTSFELAEMFGVSRNNISDVGKHYKLNYRKLKKVWSVEEEEELLKLVERGCPRSYICQKLERSNNSINKKLRELKKPAYTLWSDEEKQILIDNYYNLTFVEISKLLKNRTIEATKRKIAHMQDKGIIKKDKKNIGNPNFGRIF